MPFGRARESLSPEQADRLMERLQQQAKQRERLAEEAIKGQLNMKNMSNIDEVVFGRDMVRRLARELAPPAALPLPARPCSRPTHRARRTARAT